jgi:hypothetical protein
MLYLLDMIMDEFQHPFKDPRNPRTALNPGMSNEQLFYHLIDESYRTFKRGTIVTATVFRIKEGAVPILCRLDNGLDAVIRKEDLLG